MMERVLVVSVHPDDETLGCGGTLLRHKTDGDQIFWLILTSMNDESIWGSERIQRRDKEMDSVADGYGFGKVVNLRFETTQLDGVPTGKLVKAVAETLSDLKPSVVYLQNRSDTHSDHRISFDAVMSASKSFNHPYIKRVLMFETVSETEFAPAFQENAFLPNYFVDITEHIEKKIDLMRVYASEMKAHPFPRSDKNLRALATFRGAQCGVEYAEAFMVLKWIWK